MDCVEHDSIPRRMKEEPILSQYCGPLREQDLNGILDEYYELRGWNKETAIPTTKKLEELGLDYVVDDLRESPKVHLSNTSDDRKI
jgi:aldehyde:ferredoxin oxidoreductase